MAHVLCGICAHPSKKGATAKYGKKLVKYFEKLLDEIATGRAALVVCHSGVVELSVAACLPHFDFSNWGGSVGYCEGAILFWEDGFVNAEEIRIPQ